MLVGPRGSGTGIVEVTSSGVTSGSARVPHVECDAAPKAGACLVALKAFDIGPSARAVGRCSDRIVCLSNGMGLEREWGELAELVEPCVVLGGFTSLPGWSVETHPGGFVAKRGGIAEPLLGAAGLQVECCDEMEPRRWAKWLVNSSLNPVAALARARNDRLRALGLEPLVTHLQEELAVLVPQGIRAGSAAEARTLTGFLMEHSANRCSMLQDLEHGRPTEIGYLTGLARRISPGACPVAEAVADLLAALETAARNGRTD